MDSTPSRLDPDLLDEVIDEVVLPETAPDGLDRLSRWFSDLQRDIYDWLKSLTGGEGGWLDRFSDWARDLFSSVPGVDPVGSLFIMQIVSWLSLAVVIAVLGYALLWLWRIYRPLPQTSANPLFERMREQAAVPIDELTTAQQPAAIFYQVCLQFAERGWVNVLPDSTNQMLARYADLPAKQKQSFGELANAADRALFGGWQPAAQDIEALLASQAALLNTPSVATPS